MKKYITAKPMPFIPVGTEFEQFEGVDAYYYIETTSDNILNFTPQEMEQMEAEGWVTEVDGRWEPEYGEKYWFFWDGGIPQRVTWENTRFDKEREIFGNVFQTEEEALEASKAVKETLRTFHERRGK